MAIVRIPEQSRTIVDRDAVANYLAALGIQYEVWEPMHPTSFDAPEDEILRAYAAEIDRLKESGGYVTADVINVNAQTPNLDAMLARFSREHWHDEDEVRFIIHGRGVFHIHPANSPVFAIEVAAGDLIRVPRGTLHWFDLCSDRRIRAIRLFQNPSGWAPAYTDSGVDAQFQPVCLGAGDVPGDSGGLIVALSVSASGIHGILLDIEGTTTPISFVYDVLFPFVRLQLPDYLEHSAAEPEVQAIRRALRLEHDGDLVGQLTPPPWLEESGNDLSAVAAYVNWLMDQDRKSRPLKALQGLIWSAGYRSGRLRGEVFADVPPALERWRQQQIDVRIYSSGSELAQRLLFGSTGAGDLTRFLNGYFDTAIGAKIDPGSYRTIARAFALPPEQIVFISDITLELDAARECGLKTLLCLRPGNHSQLANGHDAISSLAEISN